VERQRRPIPCGAAAGAGLVEPGPVHGMPYAGIVSDSVVVCVTRANSVCIVRVVWAISKRNFGRFGYMTMNLLLISGSVELKIECRWKKPILNL
jgi:hypothetical protein